MSNSILLVLQQLPKDYKLFALIASRIAKRSESMMIDKRSINALRVCDDYELDTG